MAARVVDAAFAVVYLRLLGRADVGAYQFLVIFTTYLDTLVDFGLNALVAREVSRGSVTAQAAFRAVNILRLGLWVVGLPVVAIVYGPLRETANLSPEAALAGLDVLPGSAPDGAGQDRHRLAVGGRAARAYGRRIGPRDAAADRLRRGRPVRGVSALSAWR